MKHLQHSQRHNHKWKKNGENKSGKLLSKLQNYNNRKRAEWDEGNRDGGINVQAQK